MHVNEWRIRFFLILHHIKPLAAVGYDFYNIELATQVRKRGTFKLTFFYFTDKLIRNYQPHLLSDLLTFNTYFMQLQQNKALMPDPPQTEIFPNIDTRTYLQEGIKMLKQRKYIELDEYFIIAGELRLAYQE